LGLRPLTAVTRRVSRLGWRYVLRCGKSSNQRSLPLEQSFGKATSTAFPSRGRWREASDEVGKAHAASISFSSPPQRDDVGKRKGRLPAKRSSGFAMGEMARLESKIRDAPPVGQWPLARRAKRPAGYQPKQGFGTAVPKTTIEVAESCQPKAD